VEELFSLLFFLFKKNDPEPVVPKCNVANGNVANEQKKIKIFFLNVAIKFLFNLL
jgi:hypothetical protein